MARVPEPVRKVGIIEPMNLGDLLCTVPLFRALRAVWPTAEIVLIGDEIVVPFYDRFPMYLDRLVQIDEDIIWHPDPGRTRTADLLREERFDIVVKLHFWIGTRPVTSYWDEAHPELAGSPAATERD